MRLIDADALIEKSLRDANCYMDNNNIKHGYHNVQCLIYDAPTIDAVPVVRCKDCEWYVRSIIKQDGTLDKRYKPDWCDLYRKVREETYFCADGERRDDD